MDRNEKKGNPMALLPIGVFLVLYLGMGLVFEDVHRCGRHPERKVKMMDHLPRRVVFIMDRWESGYFCHVSIL